MTCCIPNYVIVFMISQIYDTWGLTVTKNRSPENEQILRKELLHDFLVFPYNFHFLRPITN